MLVNNCLSRGMGTFALSSSPFCTINLYSFCNNELQPLLILVQLHLQLLSGYHDKYVAFKCGQPLLNLIPFMLISGHLMSDFSYY